MSRRGLIRNVIAAATLACGLASMALTSQVEGEAIPLRWFDAAHAGNSAAAPAATPCTAARTN